MISSKPYQYTKGWVEFYKLKFKVTPDVLIPRPETELLIDEVLDFIYTLPKPNTLTIFDLGTGAGNIAISLAKNLSHLQGVTILATDISKKALKVAKQNAKLHGVTKSITFLQSDLLSSCKIAPDIIVANLPYIPSERIPYLEPSVKDFEPTIALDGSKDGFDLYRKLFKQLKEQNWLARRSPAKRRDEGRTLKMFVGEIDYTHGELAINEAQKYFPKARVEVKTDLSHKQRILLIGFQKDFSPD